VETTAIATLEYAIAYRQYAIIQVFAKTEDGICEFEPSQLIMGRDIVGGWVGSRASSILLTGAL
jgi:hypothetical protein